MRFRHGTEKLVVAASAVGMKHAPKPGGSCFAGKLSGALLLSALLFAPGNSVAQQSQSYSYEVSTVRPNHSASGNTSVSTNNDSYVSENERLLNMLLDTFGLQIEDQVIGLPAWATAARYDVKAKLDADTFTRLKALKPDERESAEKELMQHLLEDRFALKFHHEKRELPEYALVQVKAGTKLKPADPTNPKAGNMNVHNGKMEAYSAEIKRLGYFLSYQVHRPVEDKTGLTGKYDLALEWARDDMSNSAADGTTERAPGLFTALQEQMGLKLESIKGAVDVVVIDHIAQPTEN